MKKCLFLIILVLISAFGCTQLSINNHNKTYKVTKIESLRTSEYPDTIRLIVPKNQTAKTIGRFTNLNYKIYRVSYCIRETWRSSWEERTYFIFIKRNS